MIDLDDFDPLGRQWEAAKNLFVNEGSSEDVADEALRVVAAMLRACGGCAILPELQARLWEFYQQLAPHTLWSPLPYDAYAQFSAYLDLLSSDERVCDKRIETLAIRSTKKAALQLNDMSSPLSNAELCNQLAAGMIMDLIGHSFLDIARALSVGGRFATSEQAFHFYEEVMKHIELGALKMGGYLVRKPTAERLPRVRLVKAHHTTSSILYSSEFILD